MMHTKITATGLPEDVRLNLLDLRNEIDDLSARVENASEMMWMLSGHDDLSTAQTGTFRALESITKRFSEEIQAIGDVLSKLSRGESVPRKP